MLTGYCSPGRYGNILLHPGVNRGKLLGNLPTELVIIYQGLRMNSLTDHDCVNARCDQQRILKLHDGGGLYLWVYQDGRKYWRMRYRLGGKEKSLSLGVYPHVSLDDVRLNRYQIRSQLSSGLDPSEQRKVAHREAKKAANYRNQFRLALSNDGALKIKTQSHVVHLTSLQTKALRAFLLAIEQE